MAVIHILQYVLKIKFWLRSDSRVPGSDAQKCQIAYKKCQIASKHAKEA